MGESQSHLNLTGVSSAWAAGRSGSLLRAGASMPSLPSTLSFLSFSSEPLLPERVQAQVRKCITRAHTSRTLPQAHVSAHAYTHIHTGTHTQTRGSIMLFIFPFLASKNKNSPIQPSLSHNS